MRARQHREIFNLFERLFVFRYIPLSKMQSDACCNFKRKSRVWVSHKECKGIVCMPLIYHRWNMTKKADETTVAYAIAKCTICITFGCELENENVLIKDHIEFLWHIWLQTQPSSIKTLARAKWHSRVIYQFENNIFNASNFLYVFLKSAFCTVSIS